MVDTQQVQERIVESGVIAVLRGIDAERIVPVAREIRDAGVGAIEVTANDPRVREKVAAVDEALAGTDAVVGAGTVLDEPTAQSVIDAGAEFVLAPDVNPDVVTTCNRHGVLSAPGVMTPTEAVTAIEAGADVLKLFPASTVGPNHIGALQGPLGDVPVVPTGGIGPDNVEAFFDAGAAAVGAGSSIVDYDAIADDDMDRVRETAAAMVDAVENARD
ncbi:bifunctional 4-hydroxy-2-oxoglutarate aldolase/2-dehydro-3-deoxy-phosphogluconate aldolase [Halosolutus gelatinilyticus]|uniref:bifunctional 4-hydroxy-2-oxoglutarate aldolase/2-dehydro-3-deoxy-phosphogluconate aldolase n=1 Tax=Halosolutus gelatinilyticus TaxID=2931975 RepID=UPI001FF54DAF|nr:bifunctional 4-hydroxy-2-oxoglutarate aldolase/2-dehydro-3-deoxy-phosphogluconate aldolase [Halosolutus gelatinilyticus]